MDTKRYKIQGPDGKHYVYEAPADMSPADVENEFNAVFAEQNAPKPFDPASYGTNWRDAQAAIKNLPEGERDKALQSYADFFVAQERKDGGALQAANDYGRMFSRNLPFVGEWLDEARADLRSENSDEYNTQLALEHARRRAIDATERPGVNTPFGRIDTGDLAKTAGFLAGGAAVPLRVGQLGAIASGAVIGGTDAAADAAGMKRGTAGEKLAAGIAMAPVGAVTGGAVTGASNFIGNAAKARKPLINENAAAEATKRARDAYRVADVTGAVIDNRVRVKAPGGARRFSEELLSRLENVAASEGFLKGPHQYVRAALGEARRLASGGAGGNGPPAIGFKQLERMRQVLGNVAKSKEPTERLIAARMTAELDDLTAQVGDPNALWGRAMAGFNSPNVETNRKLYAKAREQYRKGLAANVIEQAIEDASSRAQTTGVGGNFENVLRQRLEAVEKKFPKLFSGKEKEALKQLTAGDATQNLLRSLGRASPLHHSLTGGIAAGGAYLGGGPSALALPLAGYIAAEAADKRIKRGAQQFATQVAQGRAVPQLAGPSRWQQAVQPAYESQVREIMERLLRSGATDLGTLSNDPNKE